MNTEELFDKYKVPEADLKPEPGYFKNFLGVSTKASSLPQNEELSGKVYPDPPKPGRGDGIFAGVGEYNALLTAIEGSAGQDELTIAEFGAGWGPWVSAAGVVARRHGFKKINLIAVEADDDRFGELNAHLAHNALSGAPDVTVKTYNAGVWHSDGTLNFPKAVNPLDYGARVSETSHTIDYRGLGLETFEIKALSLPTLLEGIGKVDYMHVDVQGVEFDVLKDQRELMESRVKYLFVGTHSRLIDGQLVDLLHKWDWEIHQADPCAFRYDRNVPSLQGMTLADGEIFASNPRLTGKS